MIRIDNLNLRVGAFALTGLSLQVEQGQYAVLMGRTGSGKTTLLEAVAGLVPIRTGSIHLHEQDVTRLRPADRGVGYVPQDLALFPSMTVREHLAFALTVRRWPWTAITQRVAELSDLLDLEQLLQRRPAGLSGGESQRVALGRALALKPRILLLDEPLSALDETTREEMYVLLHDVQRSTQVTTLHVTHSRTEANRLADRLLVLHNGGIQEQSASLETCRHKAEQ